MKILSDQLNKLNRTEPCAETGTMTWEVIVSVFYTVTSEKNVKDISEGSAAVQTKVGERWLGPD